MSDTYSDSRLFARSTQSEDDKPSMTGTFKQQQRFSDSDSALNKMSDHTAHAMVTNTHTHKLHYTLFTHYLN